MQIIEDEALKPDKLNFSFVAHLKHPQTNWILINLVCCWNFFIKMAILVAIYLEFLFLTSKHSLWFFLQYWFFYPSPWIKHLSLFPKSQQIQGTSSTTIGKFECHHSYLKFVRDSRGVSMSTPKIQALKLIAISHMITNSTYKLYHYLPLVLCLIPY